MDQQGSHTLRCWILFTSQGLNLVLGAFRTSPVQSLYVKANEPSLKLRHLKMGLQYAIRSKDNPAYSTVLHPSFLQFYVGGPKFIRPFGIQIRPFLEDMNVSLDSLTPTHFCSFPPWILGRSMIIKDLSHRKKSNTHPNEYQACFLDVRQRLPLHTPIYTDGSKTDNCVSSAMAVESYQCGLRIPELCSIDHPLIVQILKEVETFEFFFVFSLAMWV